MATIKRLTGGRVWASRLSVLGLLAALVGLIVAIAPALAAPGQPVEPPSGTHQVIPTEVGLGGQNFDCSAPGVDLGHLYDFRIVDPNGTYTDTQSGFTVTFEVNTYKVQGEEFMNFTVTGASVEGLIIKGGSNSTFYSYTPAVSDDIATHAPKKNNGKLYQVSHASFCYDVVGTISGTKFHDNDTDGLQDPTQEFGKAQWLITAFNSRGTSVGSDITDVFGDYTITDVPLGQVYRVCETTKLNVPGDELPGDTADVTWAWTQSDLDATYPDWVSDDPEGVRGPCFPLASQEPGGHQFLMNSSVSGIDFGNHRKVTIDCRGGAVEVTLGGPDVADDPRSTITVPGNCESGSFTSTFDVGRSDDNDDWTQFVVFGGDPNGAETIEQTIFWDEEDAMYENDSLMVPTTQVQLVQGGDLALVVFCGSLVGGVPNSQNSQCKVSGTIAERYDSAEDKVIIQLTEYFKFLGDPGHFR